YTRRVRGERNDVLTIYDHKTLSPTHEIDIPNKTASLNFPWYLSILADARHITIYNMTPAQSVSIVDVVDRKFVGEISTPGCALTMPVGERGFLMMCGDGTLQLIQLDDKGAEAKRLRSKEFFSVDEDPIFDKPIQTNNGWQLVSFESQVYEVTVDGETINISEPWSLLTEADKAEKWRVGGGQIIDVHRKLNLLFALMHQGGLDTHEDPGTEVWVFSRATKKRIARLPLDKITNNIMVTQNDKPHLAASAAVEPRVDLYDALTLKKQKTVEIGQVVGTLVAY
ncbi:MAG: amine dehydrogenase large subunit, partial [Pseudomonadota bacterium]